MIDTDRSGEDPVYQPRNASLEGQGLAPCAARYQSHFSAARAMDYMAAMTADPAARSAELLPIIALAAKPDGASPTVLDVASGTGYVADALAPCCGRAVRALAGAAPPLSRRP